MWKLFALSQKVRMFDTFLLFIAIRKNPRIVYVCVSYEWVPTSAYLLTYLLTGILC